MDNQNQNGQQITKPVPPQNVPGNPQTATHTEAAEPVPALTSKSARFTRLFYQILIGCLLGAAAIAVVAVLVGSFNDILGRALSTIVMVALHAALSFSYITTSEKQDKKDGGRSTELFSNTVFTLIVLSFITSIFAIWHLLGSSITLKLYASYAVLLFATLHADVLFRIRHFEERIDTIVAINYFFMTIVVAMLFIVIFSSSPSALGSFYYRLLAASAIVDATMTITAIIMHKMYLQKHPIAAAQATAAQSKNFWKNPLVVLLIIFLGFQVVGTLIALVLHGLRS